MIKKSRKLENVNYAIRGTLMEEANKLEESGQKILKLNIGNPAVFNFSAPSNILDSMKNNLEHSQGYSDSKGLKSAREAIKDYYRTKNVNELKLEDIYIGNGVSELILMSMQALLNPNDEILVPTPDYPLWTASVNLSGGKAVHYLCDEENLEHISIASLTKEVPIITFSGLSKSHMVAGFRIGWMCITGYKESITDYIEGLNLHSTMRLCSNVPGQSIIANAIKDIESTKLLLQKGGRLYEQRECIYNGLNNIPGIKVVKPKAAFYIFPKIDMEKYKINDDEKFALDFLKAKNILFINGTGFNWNKQDHFRIVYLADCKKLKYATDSLKVFLDKYEQNII